MRLVPSRLDRTAATPDVPNEEHAASTCGPCIYFEEVLCLESSRQLRWSVSHGCNADWRLRMIGFVARNNMICFLHGLCHSPSLHSCSLAPSQAFEVLSWVDH